MNHKHLVAITLTFYLCCTFSGYCQKGADYSAIDTENVLSYKVAEIIKMRFGGSSTHYSVSNIKLISTLDLGPGNIRIITPIYKDGKASTKVYVEIMSATKGRARERKPNSVFELIVDNGQPKLGNNPNATLAEKDQLLSIAKSVAPSYKLPRNRERQNVEKQAVPRPKNEITPRKSRERLLTQNKNTTPTRSTNTNNSSPKEKQKQTKLIADVDVLKSKVPNKLPIEKPRQLQDKVVVTKTPSILLNKTKTNKKDSTSRYRTKVKLQLPKEAKAKMSQEKRSTTKSPSVKIDRTKSNSKDSVFAGKKRKRLRLLTEKNKNKSQREATNSKERDNKHSRKEPKVKSNKKNRRSRRGGKVKVAKESVDLRRVRYTRHEDKPSTITSKDSLHLAIVTDSTEQIPHKKGNLSTKNFTLNKVRNSKSDNSKIKSDRNDKVTIDRKKKEPKPAAEKRSRKAPQDKIAAKPKMIKQPKEKGENKDTLGGPMVVVLEANRINAITAISTSATSLKPATTFLLNNMLPLAAINVDPPPVKQTSVVINVIATYERVANKGYKSADLFQKIADSYFFRDDMETAVLWYEKLFDLTNELEPVYYFRFGTALQKVGKTSKGDKMMEKFNQLKK